MLWIIYYAVSTVFFIYAFLKLTWKIWTRNYSAFPFTPNVPWLGGVPYFPKHPHEVFKRRIENSIKYNHLYVTWMTTIPVLRIGRVEYIEPLLKSSEILSKTLAYRLISDWLGNGLLISTGAKWKSRRHALTGAFHFSILNNFIEVYEKHALRVVEKLKTLSNDKACDEEQLTTTKNDNQAVEVQELMNLTLLDVICETSMGVCIDSVHSGGSEYSNAVKQMKSLFLKRLTNPLYQNRFIFPYTSVGKEFAKCVNTLHTFTVSVINENIAARQNASHTDIATTNEDEPYMKKRKIFMDILLDMYEAGEIDVEGIREEVDTIMFGGHDTTSSGLSWTLYEIGRHPIIQEKVQDEIDNISQQDCPLKDKIRLLKYTECVIKETFRMHPPVPGFARKLEKDTIFNNQLIPAGTIMNVDTHSLHMNPLYWEDPTVFDPSRFQVEKKRNPYCYVPFSAGPRNCIGQKFAMLEEKVFIYVLLLNFNIRSIQASHELKIASNIITYSMNGIHIEFSPRK